MEISSVLLEGFKPYLALKAWENFSACLNFTLDLYEGHLIKNYFFK